MSHAERYHPRTYRVVKVPLGQGRSWWLVVSEDLNDPDVWVVINRCESALEAWQYVSEVTARNRSLAEVAGCRVYSPNSRRIHESINA